MTEGLLKPTLELRWLILRNPVSQEDVLEYQRMYQCSRAEAIAKFRQEEPPVLQQKWIAEDGHEHWRTVPSTILSHSQVKGQDLPLKRD